MKFNLKNKKKRHLFYGDNPKNLFYTLSFKPDTKITLGDREIIDDSVTSILNGGFDKYKKQKVGFQVVYYLSNEAGQQIFSSTKFFFNKNLKELPNFDTYNISEFNGHIDLILINQVFKNGTAGGTDLKNDCLYKSLKQSLGNNMKISPSGLKKSIGVNRNDMIDIDDVPVVEDLLKCNINITGDFEYTSKKSYPFKTFIQLKDEHYTYKANKNVLKYLYTNGNNKDLCVYNKIADGFECYSGQDVVKFENFDDFDNFCSTNKLTKTKLSHKSTVKDEYDFLIQEADILKAYNIDLKKQSYNFTRLAKTLFYNNVRSFEVEGLSSIEENLLFKTKNCGLMYVKTGFYNSLKTYDINSFYPSILKSSHFSLPYNQGVLSKVDESILNGVIPYGLYECKISSNNNSKPFFMFNKNNTYTHYDLKLAVEQNLTIEFNHKEHNCLLYKDRIISKRVFGEYIDKIYDIKKQSKSKGAKLLLNTLWGSLCQKNYKIFKDSEKCVFKTKSLENVELLKNSIRYIKDYYYELPYARFGVFITGYGRYKMYELIKKFHHKVVRIHTDSFTIEDNTDISNIVVGENIGEFKLEKDNKKTMYKTGSNLEVIHLNKIINTK